MQSLEKELIIFTDGSSLGNPGSGGWGAVVVNPVLDEIVELGGGKPNTTNNEMELTAVISALAHSFSNTAPTKIYTDSQYVINGITNWIFNWEKNGWKTKAKEDVKNKELWEQLLKLVREREGAGVTIQWKHVLGHVGIPGNERVDSIANGFGAGENPELYRGRLSEYANKNILDIDESKIDTESGSAKNKGKAYSYLSLVDGEVKRHQTWAETESRVKGRDAKFRKALSAEHEEEILEEWGVK